MNERFTSHRGPRPAAGSAARVPTALALFLALFLGAAAALFAAEPPPPPAPPAPPPAPQLPPALATPAAKAPGLAIAAAHGLQLQPFGQFKLLKDGAIAVLSDAHERAGFRTDTFMLTCDAALYNPQDEYLYAEGHITLVEGLTRLSCTRFYYDLKHSRGWAENAEMAGLERFAPVLVQAEHPAASQPYFSALPPPDINAGTPEGLPAAAQLPPRPEESSETRLLMLRASRIERLDATHYAAANARLTSSEMPDPEWSITLQHVTYMQYPSTAEQHTRGKLEGDDATIRLFGLPSFWLPYMDYPVGLKGPFIAGEIGQSNQFGTFGNLRVGYDTGDVRAANPKALWPVLLPERSYLDITPRSDRGMGGGLTFRWQGRDDHPYDRLLLHAEGVDETWITNGEDLDRAQRFADLRTLPRETATPRRLYDGTLLYAKRLAEQGTVSVDPSLNTYGGDLRTQSYGDLHLERTPFSGVRTVADLSFASISDPQYLNEYNPEDFRTFRSGQPDAYDPSRWDTSPRAVDQGALKIFGRDLVFEGRYEQPAEKFQVAAPSFDPYGFHQTGYTPQASLFLVPMPMWGGFVAEGQAVAGRMQEYFDPILLGAGDYSSDRYGVQAIVSRPNLLDGFSLRPRIGFQATRYTNDTLGPDSNLDQASLLGGVEAVDRWSGQSDFTFKPLGLDGFDHIVEFYADYDYAGRPETDPARLPGFDAWDNTGRLQVVRFGIRQSFLNVNPDNRTDFARRYARVELSTEAFPDPVDARRLLYSGSFDALVGSFQWRPRSFFQMDGWARYWVNDAFLDNSSLALAYLPNRDFRATIRELHTGSDPVRGAERQETVTFDTEWDFSRRWRVGYAATWELFGNSLVHKGIRYQRISLTRDFGSMEIGGYVAVDPDRNNTLGLVSLKVKPSDARAWPVKDNRKVVDEIVKREAAQQAAVKAKAQAAEAAAQAANGTNPNAGLGWMQRVPVSAAVSVAGSRPASGAHAAGTHAAAASPAQQRPPQ
ncbi:MAG: hypothetical protein ACREJ2_04585 [Planctomycetota bacterium]